MDNTIDREIALELEQIECGYKQYMKELAQARAKGTNANLKPETKMLQSMIIPVSKKIEEYLLTTKKGDKLYHVTKQIIASIQDIDSIAYITCYHISQIYTPEKMLKVCDIIGTEIEHLYNYKILLANAPGYLKRVEANMTTSHLRHRKNQFDAVQQKLKLKQADWSDDQKRHIGQTLMILCLEATGRYTLTKTYCKGDSHSTYYIQPTEDTLEWLEKFHTNCALYNVDLLPMICKPNDWSDISNGGYLVDHPRLRTNVMKTRDAAKLEALKQSDLERLFSVLNTLQNTRWAINTQVLEVMEVLKDSTIGGLPEMDIERNLPETPWSNDEEYKTLLSQHPEQVKMWKRSRSEAYGKWYTRMATRLTFVEQLTIARRFATEEAIYFVYTVDWRGRVYPVQRYLHPQTDKIGKALLRFADGKALGSTGARWLAIHGANVFGEDKLPLDERVRWVTDNQTAILESAQNPVDGSRFWTAADKPFQFLAFCFEWAGYIAEGESFVSHLPIAVDASCSGLQHFSAILKDEIGGAYVNLTPQSKPNDVYAAVAAESIKIVDDDIKSCKTKTKTVSVYYDAQGKLLPKPEKKEVTVDQSAVARLWQGKITRGITKRNVMTLPYGATRKGFEDQLIHELAKLDADAERDPNTPDTYLNNKFEDTPSNHEAAVYLAEVNEQAISKVVVKAFEAMSWLKELVKVLSKKGLPMTWTTPFGLNIVMNYKQMKIKRLKMHFAGAAIQVNARFPGNTLDSRKQTNGVSPNVIHSFDAAHLMATVYEMAQTGVESFAVIHDSFGTHACNMDRLNATLRHTFIKQYSGNLLEDILTQAQPCLTDKEYKTLKKNMPSEGSLNLSELNQALYFCS